MLCVKTLGVLAKPLDMDAEFVAVHGVRLQIDGLLVSQPIVLFCKEPMLIRDGGPCLTQFRAHRRILAARGGTFAIEGRRSWNCRRSSRRLNADLEVHQYRTVNGVELSLCHQLEEWT